MCGVGARARARTHTYAHARAHGRTHAHARAHGGTHARAQGALPVSGLRAMLGGISSASRPASPGSPAVAGGSGQASPGATASSATAVGGGPAPVYVAAGGIMHAVFTHHAPQQAAPQGGGEGEGQGSPRDGAAGAQGGGTAGQAASPAAGAPASPSQQPYPQRASVSAGARLTSPTQAPQQQQQQQAAAAQGAHTTPFSERLGGGGPTGFVRPHTSSMPPRMTAMGGGFRSFVPRNRSSGGQGFGPGRGL